MRVGILAVQGAIEAHARALAELGARARSVLHPGDLDGLDALVLPGGESTTIANGLRRLGLFGPLRAFAASGRPVLGTCAGAILLAREAGNAPVETLGALDVAAVRNAYGTQVDSFAATADPTADPEFAGMRCVFIRAPQLEKLGPSVRVLARVDGRPVLVRQGSIVAATFHPELTRDLRVHRHFLDGQRAIQTKSGESAAKGLSSKSP